MSAGWLGLAVVAAAAAGARGETATKRVHYSRDIKPILSNHCYTCHGPDENKRKAGLRLDTAEGAVAELPGGGRAVVPGNSARSLLIDRVNAADPDEIMPPPKTGKSLTVEEKKLLQAWVEQGAGFDAHWSYVRPVRPGVPKSAKTGGSANPIDEFVLAGLEVEQIEPGAEADRRTLVRRLSFDLTGLPPGPEEVEAFAADSAPDAWEQLVDRLLDRPQFGERMAMYWLDLVRYADTNGIHGDTFREVSAFRDYVIQSFNDNKPFDWFTIEQLAGDLLPNATTEQRIASGYNRLLLTTEEGGAQPKEYIAKYLADRVRNVSTVWLGSTMGCAECHDHKYDPFTTRDFYSLGAFFADVQEVAVGKQVPELELPTGAQAARLQRLKNQMAAAQLTLDTSTPQLEAEQAKWEQELAARPSPWTVLRPLVVSSQHGAEMTVEADNSVRVSGLRPETDRYVVSAHSDLVGITAVRLEVLPDERLPAGGPGRADNGNLVLSDFRVTAAAIGSPGEAWRVDLQNATADFSQEGFPVANAIDDKAGADSGWAILPHNGKAHQAVFETKADLGTAGGTLLAFVLEQPYAGGHSIGRFRLSVTTLPRPVKADGIDGPPEDIREILAVKADQRSPEQRTRLAAYYRGIAPSLEPVRRHLASLENQRTETQGQVKTMLVAVSGTPREVRVLPRGNWMDDSGEVVTPAPPGVLPRLAMVESRATRLDLARWLMSRENPLVARVMVNRFWKLMFGQGLVKTLDDFGSQGAWPTHPELLDWLAMEFMDSGWDVKHMIRLMATSAAYRRSSNWNEHLKQADPTNRWLARQGRWRLDAEMVRDNALLVSGLISLRIGGPSVKPYQPAGYWSFLNFPIRDWYPDHGENQYRRGLYTHWQRMFLHPSLLAFDAPSREECCVERTRSNTPLQSLVLLNDPTYVEAARVFAARIIAHAGRSTPERIVYAYRQALARQPSPEETRLLAELYDKHRRQYAADPAAAQALLKVGDFEASKDADPAELAAWTSVARVVFNLHEFITRY